MFRFNREAMTDFYPQLPVLSSLNGTFTILRGSKVQLECGIAISDLAAVSRKFLCFHKMLT